MIQQRISLFFFGSNQNFSICIIRKALTIRVTYSSNALLWWHNSAIYLKCRFFVLKLNGHIQVKNNLHNLLPQRKKYHILANRSCNLQLILTSGWRCSLFRIQTLRQMPPNFQTLAEHNFRRGWFYRILQYNPQIYIFGLWVVWSI